MEQNTTEIRADCPTIAWIEFSSPAIIMCAPILYDSDDDEGYSADGSISNGRLSLLKLNYVRYHITKMDSVPASQSNALLQWVRCEWLAAGTLFRCFDINTTIPANGYGERIWCVTERCEMGQLTTMCTNDGGWTNKTFFSQLKGALFMVCNYRLVSTFNASYTGLQNQMGEIVE